MSTESTLSLIEEKGELQIGDSWNAITIIALSQTNPLKALAEFVENSIDANAKNIHIIKGKENKKIFLRIVDDGDGIPDFNYVATHIGDSIKRQLKTHKGGENLQGEFGIGLLSFWIVGETLKITSKKKDESIVRQMILKKGDPTFEVTPVNKLKKEKVPTATLR